MMLDGFGWIGVSFVRLGQWGAWVDIQGHVDLRQDAAKCILMEIHLVGDMVRGDAR